MAGVGIPSCCILECLSRKFDFESIPFTLMIAQIQRPYNQIDNKHLREDKLRDLLRLFVVRYTDKGSFAQTYM